MSELFDRMVLLDGDQAVLVAEILDSYARIVSGSRERPPPELEDPALAAQLADAIRRQLDG